MSSRLEISRKEANRESVRNGIILHGAGPVTVRNVRQATPVSARRPTISSEDRRDIVGAGLAGVEDAVGRGGKMILKNAPEGAIVAKGIGKAALGVPSLAFDVAGIAAAPEGEERNRKIAETAGGMAGGVAGGWAGPVGVAVGSYLGGKAGGAIYDHRDDIAREIRDTYDSAARGFGEAAMNGYGPGDTDARVRRLFLRY